VNTLKAGSGALSVTVDGPSKVQLECREVPEGQEFTYTPTVPGDYLIVIKFGGNCHIPSSPFKARITGKPICYCNCFRNCTVRNVSADANGSSRMVSMKTVICLRAVLGAVQSMVMSYVI